MKAFQWWAQSDANGSVSATPDRNHLMQIMVTVISIDIIIIIINNSTNENNKWTQRPRGICMYK